MTKKFRYALFNRPAGLGAVPENIQYSVLDQPLRGSPHHTTARHGILVTDRELTIDELRTFGLMPLVNSIDIKFIDALAEKVANGYMSEYAAAYLRAQKDDPEMFRAAVNLGIERINSRVFYSFEDEAGFVRRVGKKLAEVAGLVKG